MYRSFTGSSLRSRALLSLAVPLTSLLFLLCCSTGQAQASVGFCEFAKLKPGQSCESSPFTEITEVVAEVTSGSAEICVSIHESSGVFLGTGCGSNYAVTQSGVGAKSAKAWVGNKSKTATITVFGVYLT
jgi:hypothetical protein